MGNSGNNNKTQQIAYYQLVADKYWKCPTPPFKSPNAAFQCSLAKDRLYLWKQMMEQKSSQPARLWAQTIRAYADNGEWAGMYMCEDECDNAADDMDALSERFERGMCQ
jgi:hypothetical protein